MKFKIFNENGEDYFIVEGTLKECNIKAIEGTNKRNWKNPYSIKIKK